MLLAAAARGGDGGSVDAGGGGGGILLKDVIPVLGPLFAVNVLLNDMYWPLITVQFRLYYCRVFSQPLQYGITDLVLLYQHDMNK